MWLLKCLHVIVLQATIYKYIKTFIMHQLCSYTQYLFCIARWPLRFIDNGRIEYEGSYIRAYRITTNVPYTPLQWSYGVTCWELFTGGKIPYPGVDPVSLPRLLESGHRLDKPNNAACSEKMYDVSTLLVHCGNTQTQHMHASTHTLHMHIP